MWQQFNAETWFLIGAGGSLVGLVLIIVGLWRRRKGNDPHCRKCGYNLTGLPEPRCPECGIEITQKLIRYGTRHRRPIYSLIGLVILLTAATPIYHSAVKINWYTHYPASWVARDLLQSTTSLRSYQELSRRIRAGQQESVARALMRSYATKPSGRLWYELLAMTDLPEAKAHLEKLLSSEDAETRGLAALGLGYSSRRWAAPILVRALDNPLLHYENEDGSVLHWRTPAGKIRSLRRGSSKPAGMSDDMWQQVESAFRDIPPWPETHHAYQGLFVLMWRMGVANSWRGYTADRPFEVDAEIKRVKAWWAKYGDDFMQGNPVPNPNLVKVPTPIDPSPS